MKKTLLATTVALALTAGTSAQAAVYDINITNMVFGGNFASTGNITEAGGSFNSTELFNNNHYYATQVAVFDESGTWAETGGLQIPGYGEVGPDSANDDTWINSFSYDFTLTEGQIAVGLSFDWSTNYDIPVLAIFDCAAGVCSGQAMPMAAGPFPDQEPAWTGTGSITQGAPAEVPVPAAVWLFGSGLVGLAGIARRRKTA